MTLSDRSAISGAIALSPSPVTIIRGGGCVSARAAAAGSAIEAASASGKNRFVIKNSVWDVAWTAQIIAAIMGGLRRQNAHFRESLVRAGKTD
jgi:hypothetical protein